MHPGRNSERFSTEEQGGGAEGEYIEYDQEEEEKKLRKAEFEAGYDTGVMDKVKEIIQYMLKSGEPVEKIARYTGYTVEEVKEIIKTSQ